MSLSIHFNIANETDLPKIVALLADDDLGKNRENLSAVPDPKYVLAFLEILSDPNNEVIVGRAGEELVAVIQITYIPNLTLQGTKRAQIEGVRVSSSFRGQGIGQQLFKFALDRAKQKGCLLAQLTTHMDRPKAFQFYKKLGFSATHVGFKLPI